MAYGTFETTFEEGIYVIPPPLTVILDRPWSAQPPECKEALTKLLAAVNHSPESVRMVHQEHVDLSDWAEPPSCVVAFVPPIKGVPMNERITTLTTSMVITEPLSVLLANEDTKRKFWAAFKTLFA